MIENKEFEEWWATNRPLSSPGISQDGKLEITYKYWAFQGWMAAKPKIRQCITCEHEINKHYKERHCTSPDCRCRAFIDSDI